MKEIDLDNLDQIRDLLPLVPDPLAGHKERIIAKFHRRQKRMVWVTSRFTNAAFLAVAVAIALALLFLTSFQDGSHSSQETIAATAIADVLNDYHGLDGEDPEIYDDWHDLAYAVIIDQ